MEIPFLNMFQHCDQIFFHGNLFLFFIVSEMINEMIFWLQGNAGQCRFVIKKEFESIKISISNETTFFIWNSHFSSKLFLGKHLNLKRNFYVKLLKIMLILVGKIYIVLFHYHPSKFRLYFSERPKIVIKQRFHTSRRWWLMDSWEIVFPNR
jgi:hypothetical protein